MSRRVRLVVATQRAVPSDCPRRPGELGPRACGRWWCPHNLWRPPSRGPWRRARPPDPDVDTCSLDVAACVRRARTPLSYEVIGGVLGVSRQAAQNVARTALRKVARALGVSERDAETLLALAGCAQR